MTDGFDLNTNSDELESHEVISYNDVESVRVFDGLFQVSDIL
jgi:hypothetical protein